MHRHGYKGRKFHRETDQRSALIKGLADSLVLNGSITTTLPKAKEIRPYVEKLVTKAKKGDLHNRRQVISKLQTLESAHRLVDEIAPKLKDRHSGYLRIKKIDNRRGDNAQMATISFVDNITEATAAKVEKTEKPIVKVKPAAKKKPTVKKPAAKTVKKAGK